MCNRLEKKSRVSEMNVEELKERLKSICVSPFHKEFHGELPVSIESSPRGEVVDENIVHTNPMRDLPIGTIIFSSALSFTLNHHTGRIEYVVYRHKDEKYSLRAETGEMILEKISEEELIRNR